MFQVVQNTPRAGLARELVRALFCGLPRKERRVAVFVASIDESAGKNHRSQFFRGGFIAPVLEWEDFITPAWEQAVLHRQPLIPYLHMVDIRSPKWRAEHGLSDREAEYRIDEAIRVIATSGRMYAITSDMDAGHFRDAVTSVKLILKSRIDKAAFTPDFLCFLAFAYTSLAYVLYEYPDAERVDFVIEQNGRMTDHIRDFHELMKPTLEKSGHPDWARLVGGLIPGGKDRVPLQAADVLCWYAQRRHADLLDRTEGRRYYRLARKFGRRHRWPREEITEFVRSAALALPALSGREGVSDEAQA